MAALKRNGLARPGAIHGAGAEHGRRTPTKRIPAFSRGRGPRTPAIPGCCALFVRSPRRAGGLLALCALRLRRAQGFGRFAPRCAPLPPASLRAVARLPPPALALGGRGWVPSRPCRPLPAGASAAPGGGGLGGLGFAGAFWGCLVAAFASVPSASCVLASARCCLAPWAGSALGVSFRPSSRALSGSVAVVRFASPAGAGAFARSWSRRLPRGLPWLRRSPGSRRRGRGAVVGGFRSGGAAARSGSPGWRVARPGGRVRRPLRGCRVAVAGLLSVFAAGLPAACRRPARAGLGGRGVRGLPLAFAGSGRGAPRALVWLARAGLRPARSRLAGCRGVAPGSRGPAPFRAGSARSRRAGRPPCRACRCRFPRVAVFLAPRRVPVPLFLFARATFFRVFLAIFLVFQPIFLKNIPIADLLLLIFLKKIDFYWLNCYNL